MSSSTLTRPFGRVKTSRSVRASAPENLETMIVGTPARRVRLRDRFDRGTWIAFAVIASVTFVLQVMIVAVIAHLLGAGYGANEGGTWRLGSDGGLLLGVMVAAPIFWAIGFPLTVGMVLAFFRVKDSAMLGFLSSFVALALVFGIMAFTGPYMPSNISSYDPYNLPESWVEQQVDEQLGGHWAVVGKLSGLTGAVTNETGEIRAVNLVPTNGDEYLLHVEVGN